MIDYGFEENNDYITNRQKSPVANGGYKIESLSKILTGRDSGSLAIPSKYKDKKGVCTIENILKSHSTDLRYTTMN